MTTQQLFANVRVNLVFYRRNRIMVLAAIVLALLFTIVVISQAWSASKQFDLVQGLISMFEDFCFAIAALLGLMTVSHHVRSRSVKLVITKPCTLGTWVLSHLVSATIVVLALHVLAFIGGLVMFAAWGLPAQWGLLASLALSFLNCVLVFGFLLLLSTLVHPVVAVVIATTFNPSALHSMLTMLQVPRLMSRGRVSGFLYDSLAGLITGLYYAVPEYQPFSSDMAQMLGTWRVTAYDGPYLILSGLYVALVVSLSVMLTVAILRHKRLI